MADIEFFLDNPTDNSLIPNVTVTLGTMTATQTGLPGQPGALFAGVLPGTYPYSTSVSGWQQATGTVVVGADGTVSSVTGTPIPATVDSIGDQTTINIYLVRLTGSARFSLIDQATNQVINFGIGPYVDYPHWTLTAPDFATGATAHENPFTVTNLPAETLTLHVNGFTMFGVDYAEFNGSVTVVAGTTIGVPVVMSRVGTTQTGTLHAAVVDAATQMPVVGANVTVAGVTKQTDTSGQADFPGIPVGTVAVACSASGYANQQTTATINVGQTANVNFALVATGPGGQTGDLCFTLLDPTTQQPIVGATISLLDASGAVIATAGTDQNGQVCFTGLAPGNYTVMTPLGNFPVLVVAGTTTNTTNLSAGQGGSSTGLLLLIAAGIAGIVIVGTSQEQTQPGIQKRRSLQQRGQATPATAGAKSGSVMRKA